MSKRLTIKNRNCAKCNCEFLTKATIGRSYSYCPKCRSKMRKEDWIKNKDKIAESNRHSHIKKKYGLDKKAYEIMLKTQDGACAICKDQKPLAVDHNHESGDIRGLLCRACNTALGMFKDNIEVLTNAISYLNNFKK